MPEKFSSHIHSVIKSLPETPGVYQYYDQQDNLLYVGKAKNLKKRVNSYFTKEHESARLRILVRKIKEIKTIKVNTEVDALLLENNLIKSLKPRYNILLRDDKTYPWIVIKKERFSRLFYTRNHIKDGSDYFGPYASSKLLNTLLDIIKQTYPLRNCNFDLSEQNITKNKFKACLEYQIGRCKAPCIDKQSLSDYNQNINEIKQLIKGDVNSIISDLKQKMNQAAESYAYEIANELKLKIDSLIGYQSKSTIVHPTITNTDVIHLLSDEKNAYVHYFKIMNGAIIYAQTIELKKKMDESDAELLLFAIIEFRNRFNSQSKEILVPFAPSLNLPDCEFIVPKIGDKKKLLDLCYKNALAYKYECEKQIAITDPDIQIDRIMNQMQKDLRMKEQPRLIEGFDNSNFQGDHAVSAMPVFINGKPAKKLYRHFNVKTVKGPDDYATMEEVIYRRYSRVLEENLPLPQLIVIDGGKGQLSAAVNSLNKLNLIGKIAIIGIAKRLEEIYFPNDPIPLYLDKRSETLKIIQQLRDEAHRFGITHHRNKRSRETFKTELNEIKGISNKTAEKLLIALKSVIKIKQTSLINLEQLIGKSKAKLVYEYFQK